MHKISMLSKINNNRRIRAKNMLMSQTFFKYSDKNPRVSSFRLQFTQTGVPLQEQRIYGPCAPRRCLQLCQHPLLTYSGVP